MNIRAVVFLTVVIIGVTAIENKKPAFQKNIKELGDEIRDRRNLEYSLTLPHSHVASFRSLERRISSVPHESSLRNIGQLYQGRQGYGVSRRARPSLPAPLYAVQMEPMVQYSQKDPLYDANGDNLEDGITRNEIQAQPKIFSVKLNGDQVSENNYLSENIYSSHRGDISPPGPPYGPVVLPYYDHPEPIIEIIIKESNESLPAPPVAAPPTNGARPKEPVQVFYVKYQENPHGNGKDVIYDKPIPAITPPTNGESENHHHEYTTLAPEIQSLPPPPSTTLRAVIHPDSEHYHSDSGVRITFGNSEERSHHHHHHHHHDAAISEGHEESAPHVAVAFPHAPLNQQDSASQFQKRQQAIPNDQQPFNNKPNQFPHPQQRIQFQPTNQPSTFSPLHQQLPNPNSPVQQFRQVPNQFPRLPNAPLFNGPQRPPNVHNPQPSPPHHGPPSQGLPTFRQPNFQQRPVIPSGASNTHRVQFKQSPQRPFHQGPQPQQFQFNEHEYLQQNYHTITTEQFGPHHEQQLPNDKQPLNFREVPRPAPSFSQPPREPAQPQFPQPPREHPQQQFSQAPREPAQAPFSISQEEYNKRYYEQLQHFKQQEQRQRQRLPPITNSQPSQVPKFQELPIESPKQQPIQINHNSQSNIQTNGPIRNVNQHKNFQQQQQQQQQHHNVQQTRTQITQTQSISPPQPSPSPQIQQGQQQFQQQLLGSHFIPPGGEVIASVPKYEQHLLITPSSNNGHIQNTQILPQPSPLIQHFPQNGPPQINQNQGQRFADTDTSPAISQDFLSVFEQNQREILRLQAKLRMSEEEQKKLLALTQKVSASSTQAPRIQISPINQHKYISNEDKYQFPLIQGRNPQSKPYVAHNTNRPPLISSTSSPNSFISSTTPQYVTPTTSKILEKSKSEKKEKTKKPIEFDLPDEVPDELRQQLLSSGILENAQISILDYDKVGDIPLESLPPEQLANFYGAGGGLQISGSAPVASVVNTKGDSVKSNFHDVQDQDEASSETKKAYLDPYEKKRNVEMKVVHFDPSTTKGQRVAEKYVQDGAKHVEPVSLNDKYNRYLPLKVNGAHFPLPDVPELLGRKVTSVVVLAPVNYEFPKSDKDGGRTERATSNKARGVSFVAGDALKRLVKTPTLENYKKWLEKENTTSPDLQSVVLLVTGKTNSNDDKEIFMYDVATQTVSRLSGELSSAFVDVAETNAHSKDFDQLTVADSGIVESTVKVVAETKSQQQKPLSKDKYSNHKSVYTEVDSKKHSIVDTNISKQISEYGTKHSTETPSVKYSQTRRISAEDDDDSQKTVNKVLISSGYSRMKMGRSLRTDE